MRGRLVSSKTAEERFWDKVSPEPNSGCWLWCGAADRKGYGLFYFNDKCGKAHRFSYKTFAGPLVDGLQLDHLCRNPSCVNPLHLEQVTAKENIWRSDTVTAVNARKTHCHKGHALFGDNLRITTRGRRECIVCHREHVRRHRSKQPTKPRAVKTHCPQGHPYNEENTYRDHRGYRNCRICLRDQYKRYNAKRKAKGQPQ